MVGRWRRFVIRRTCRSIPRIRRVDGGSRASRAAGLTVRPGLFHQEERTAVSWLAWSKRAVSQRCKLASLDRAHALKNTFPARPPIFTIGGARWLSTLLPRRVVARPRIIFIRLLYVELTSPRRQAN